MISAIQQVTSTPSNFADEARSSLIKRLDELNIVYDHTANCDTAEAFQNVFINHRLHDGSDDSHTGLINTLLKSRDQNLLIDCYKHFHLQEKTYLQRHRKEQATQDPFTKKYKDIDLRELFYDLKEQDTDYDKLVVVQNWVKNNFDFSNYKNEITRRKGARQSEHDFALTWNQTTAEMLKYKDTICFDFARLKQEIVVKAGFSRHQTMVVHENYMDYENRKHTLLVVKTNQNESYVMDYKLLPILTAEHYNHNHRPLFGVIDGKLIPFVNDGSKPLPTQASAVTPYMERLQNYANTEARHTL